MNLSDINVIGEKKVNKTEKHHQISDGYVMNPEIYVFTHFSCYSRLFCDLSRFIIFDIMLSCDYRKSIHRRRLKIRSTARLRNHIDHNRFNKV